MQRREFITLLSGTATASLVLSRVAFAQQLSTKVFRIGSWVCPRLTVSPSASRPFARAFVSLAIGRDKIL